MVVGRDCGFARLSLVRAVGRVNGIGQAEKVNGLWSGQGEKSTVFGQGSEKGQWFLVMEAGRVNGRGFGNSV